MATALGPWHQALSAGFLPRASHPPSPLPPPPSISCHRPPSTPSSAQSLQGSHLTHRKRPRPPGAPSTPSLLPSHSIPSPLATMPLKLAKLTPTSGPLHSLFPALPFPRSSRDCFKPLLTCPLGRKAVPGQLLPNIPSPPLPPHRPPSLLPFFLLTAFSGSQPIKDLSTACGLFPPRLERKPCDGNCLALISPGFPQLQQYPHVTHLL